MGYFVGKRETSKKGAAVFSNMPIVVFILYIAFVWLQDLTCFVLFYAKIENVEILKWILPLAASGGLIYLFRNSITVEKSTRKLGIGWLFIVIIIGFSAYKMLLPDLSYDTMSYHVLLQEPQFRDFINDFTFPGHFQGFGFPLADRIFYIFRAILGYRLGTVLNVICSVIAYLQVIRILEKICAPALQQLRDMHGIKRVLTVFANEKLWAFAIIMSHNFVIQLGSYLVEIASLVLLLESVWFLIRKDIGKKDIIVFAILQGLVFVLKMTNIVFVVPMLLFFILKNYKQIKPKLFVICLTLGVLPSTIYLIHNFIMTGNPVFPYFNLVFKSPYFLPENFKDIRWAPQTLFETVLWPLSAVFRPEYRQSEISNPYSIGLIAMTFLCAMGSVIALIKSIRPIKQSQNKSSGQSIVACIMVSSGLLWSLSTGHIRYFILGITLLVLLGVCISINWLVLASWKSAIAALCLLAIAPAPWVYMYMSGMGIEWCWKPPISASISDFVKGNGNFELYEGNIKMLLKDQRIGSKEQQQKADVFICWGIEVHLLTLLNPNVPICRMESVSHSVQGEKKAEITQRIDGLFDEGKNIYAIVSENEEAIAQEILLKHGFIEDSREKLEKGLYPEKSLYLIKIKKK